MWAIGLDVTLSRDVPHRSNRIWEFARLLSVSWWVELVHSRVSVSKLSWNGTAGGVFICLLAFGSLNDVLHTEELFVAPYSAIYRHWIRPSSVSHYRAYFSKAGKSGMHQIRLSCIAINNWMKSSLSAKTCSLRTLSCRRITKRPPNSALQADKLATLGTMVAGVAHDIANPTGLIKLSREQVLKGHESAKGLILEH